MDFFHGSTFDKNEVGMTKAVPAIFISRRNLICRLQNLSVQQGR